jgi:S-adenosylmethionine synthetase
MPLVKSRIKETILRAFDAQAGSANNPDEPDKSRDKIADAIADAVITEIKGMSIIIVGTAGTYPLVITSITIT